MVVSEGGWYVYRAFWIVNVLRLRKMRVGAEMSLALVGM